MKEREIRFVLHRPKRSENIGSVRGRGLGRRKPTATKAIDVLVDLRILKETSGRRRGLTAPARRRWAGAQEVSVGLVIIESPNKRSRIAEYLGVGFLALAKERAP